MSGFFAGLSMKQPNERGSVGAVLVTAVALVLTLAFYISCVLIAWYGAARQAQQGAELAALAAVSSAVQGESPCRSAEDVATRNKVKISSCQVRGQGREVVVEVEVQVELAPVAWMTPSPISRNATAGT